MKRVDLKIYPSVESSTGFREHSGAEFMVALSLFDSVYSKLRDIRMFVEYEKR